MPVVLIRANGRPAPHVFVRRLVSVLFLVTGFSSICWAEPRVRVGVEMADKPISFLDAKDNPTGFTAALLAEMSRAGLGEVQVVAKPWSRLLEDFNAGRIDVLANVARTEERLRDMDFSISHAHVHGLIYTRPDRPALRTTADFTGKTIAALKGSISLTNAQTHGGWGATIVPVTDPQGALDALRRGDYDAVLLIYGLEAKFIRDNHGLRREFVEDIVHEFRFAVRKGEAATLARLNDALAKVRHHGAFDRLYDEWIGPIEPHPIRLGDLRPYAVPIFLGFVVVVFLFSWQRRMLAQVSRQAQALRESEERFHGLVDAAFEGWIVHRDGKIILANPSFARTFGYSVDELIGQSLHAITPPELHAALDAAPPAVNLVTHESVGLRKDGTRIPIETSCRDCMFEGQPARISAMRDLTAQKQAANDQLVLSKLESTGILAGGIAHDFNNLLATIVLNVDMALLDPRQSEAQARYLRNSKNAAMAAKSLTQQLVTFAEGDAAERRVTDLASLLRNTVSLALSGSNLRADINTAADLWCADVDAVQIDRVISSLVLNARDAMPTGGVVAFRAQNVVLTAGEVTSLPAGEYVQLDIADQGHGIPAELIPKIFDPYFSTKQRGTQKGMGLGLTISHSIVHQHGGAITVESGSGAGATFRVFLPGTRRRPADETKVAEAKVVTSGRILVMDDENSLRETVRMALEHEGYTVETAADGVAAIALYKVARQAGLSFDAVVLDLTVRGGMGGLETFRALRAIDPAVKALVMSGYAQETVLRDFAQHGFGGALTKPFDLDSLRRAVARIVAS